VTAAGFLAPLLALLIAWCTVYGLLRSRIAARLLDRPNERSLHETPVPRLGGLGVDLGIVVTAAVFGLPLRVWVVPFVLLIALSLLDDWKSMPAAARLLGHLVAAAIFVVTALPEFSYIGMAITVIAVAWMSNLYNFMDGSDGLAGGMALFGFGFYGVAAAWAGDAPFALLCLSVAGAALGFLFFNFPPARIFMGDCGSVPLGFLAAALGIVGWHNHYWPAWFPALVFSPFVVDASVTLARRALRGEKVWLAHRSHYYQRLVQAGWGHLNTGLMEYALMIACGLAALAGREAALPTQIAVLAGAAAVYLTLILILERVLPSPGARI
jgi:UDP-N-acetylmuramyl pentapeptide phosphotransferase/UDP-N-acetylglucosamine-1-phosphate transferase